MSWRPSSLASVLALVVVRNQCYSYKKVSAEPSGDVGARRYQATRSVKQPFSKTPLSGRLDSVRGQLIDLPEALKVRVAQEDRPNGVGNICIAILARELQSLGVVRVHLQCHVPWGRSGLHSLVILKPGLNPAVVQLLRWLIQDQLEVDFGATMFSIGQSGKRPFPVSKSPDRPCKPSLRESLRPPSFSIPRG